MPGKYIGILSVGPALAGLVMNVVRAITLLAFPGLDTKSKIYSSILFYAMAAFNLLLCLLAGFYEKGSPFFKHYNGLMNNKFAENRRNGVTKRAALGKLWEALKSQWKPLFALGLNFIVTFTVLPGVSNDLTLDFVSDPDWRDLFLITIGNLCDFGSRVCAQNFKFFRYSPNWQIFWSFLRIVFIVFMLLIANKVGPDFLFGSDWFKILNLSAFFWINGMNTMNTSVSAAVGAPEHLKEEVGALIGTLLTGGILVGSLLQIPMKGLVPKRD